jgi:hypothetical protein
MNKMTFFNMFKTPYLGADPGAGGGSDPIPPVTDPPAGDPPQSDPPVNPAIKVKFNHEEREIPYEEAVTHIQKGMNYDKAVERARQEARDAWIAEQGYEWKGKPIKTEAEYKQALQEKETEDRIRAQYSNVPDEIVQKLLKVDELERWKSDTEKKSQDSEAQSKADAEKQARQQRENEEFFAMFKAENGRDFDPNTDKLPKELVAYLQKGMPIDYAYSRYLIDQKRVSTQTQEANTKNAQTSTGSVKTSGKTGGFISFEDFEANKHNQKWVRDNLDTIEESRKRWK